MSVDSFERGVGYVSDGLVERMAWDQAARLGMAEGSPALAVTLGIPHPASESYAMQALNHGKRLADLTYGSEPPVRLYVPSSNGFDILRTPDDFRAAQAQGLYVPETEREKLAHDDNLVELTKDLNADSDVTGQLHLFPTATREGQQGIRNTIDPHQDPDGISPNRLVTPATPEAQVAIAEDILGTTIDRIDPRAIGIIGNGDLVGGPLLNEVLPRHGVETAELGAVLANKDQILEGVPKLGERDIRVIFTAIPVGSLIRRGYVREDGTIIIDAGYGRDPETQQPGGNVHPDLMAVSGLHSLGADRANAFTGFRRGVGPVTTAIVYDRTIPPGQAAGFPPSDRRNLAVIGA